MTITAATSKNTILSTGQSSSTLPLVPPLYALLLADDGSPDKSNTVSIVFLYYIVIARFDGLPIPLSYCLSFDLFRVHVFAVLLLWIHAMMLSHVLLCLGGKSIARHMGRLMHVVDTLTCSFNYIHTYIHIYTVCLTFFDFHYTPPPSHSLSLLQFDKLVVSPAFCKLLHGNILSRNEHLHIQKREKVLYDNSLWWYIDPLCSPLLHSMSESRLAIRLASYVLC